MSPVKLLGRAASTAVHAARHPISSAAYAAGMARGLTGAAIHGATALVNELHAPPPSVPTQRADTVGGTGTAPTPTPATTVGPPEPQRVAKPIPDPADLPEPIVIEPRDEDPGEAFATEPKAVSRDSAHGGTDAVDAQVDAWEDEAAEGLDLGPDIDIETPVGTTGADVGHNPDTAEAGLQQPLTEPLLDPATAKAIRKETETLRDAADPDRG